MTTHDSPLLSGLTPAQLQAAQLTKTLLDCFNGQGLLDGVTRYNVLEGRLKLAATRARDLGALYSLLARSLHLPQPNAEQQAELLPLLTDGTDAPAVLRCLATETPYVVMLAREMHATTRDVRKAVRQARRDADAVPKANEAQWGKPAPANALFPEDQA